MRTEIEYRYFTEDMKIEGSPLSKKVEEIANNGNYKKLIVYSVFQDKNELPFLYRKWRNFYNDTRHLHKSRKLIQPRIKKEKGVCRIFYTAENARVDMKYCDYAFGFHWEEEINHPNYQRLPYYAYEGDIFGLEESTRQDLLESLPEKIKFCEFVYGHSVPMREKLFHLINSLGKVTSPGSSCNNALPLGESKSAKESRKKVNWLEERRNFALPFKFSIACENEQFSGYISEKIVTAYNAGCIPIYKGAPDVVKDFNAKSFINANELSDEELLEVIKRLDQDEQARMQMLKEPPITSKRVISYFSA